MSLVSQLSSLTPQWESIPKIKERIRLQVYPGPCSPELIVDNLASIEGPIDIYCWYEGSQCLPKLGADFMKKFIFEPLYRLKQETKLYLYSLKGWDFKKNTSIVWSTTPLGEAINRINKTAVECIYSSSFFQYCTDIQKKNSLCKFLNEELPKKKWLFRLSENQRKKDMTIAELFNEKRSWFDSFKDLDVSVVYPLIQYVEGYYLIRKSVENGLLNGQKKIQIAFVLPNDEGKYYLDYTKDIKKMLQMDLGKGLLGVDVNISFQFFKYGDSLNSRPYVDKQRKAIKVEARDIDSYFDYLSQSSISREQPMTFLRDRIHDINGDLA